MFLASDTLCLLFRNVKEGWSKNKIPKSQAYKLFMKTATRVDPLEFYVGNSYL